MVKRNPYESYRHEGMLGARNAQMVESVMVYNSREEHVLLRLLRDENGRFFYGYDILFPDGRTAVVPPGTLAGWFDSCRQAQLYFLGHMVVHRNYFSEECVKQVRLRILDLIDQSLFE